MTDFQGNFNSKEILLEGREYLSLKMASEFSGYHSDYLGRLARGGKLKSRRIGIQWFIEKEGLESFLKERSPDNAGVKTNVAKSLVEEIKLASEAPSSSEVKIIIPEPPPEIPSPTRRDTSSIFIKNLGQKLAAERRVVFEVAEKRDPWDASLFGESRRAKNLRTEVLAPELIDYGARDYEVRKMKMPQINLFFRPLLVPVLAAVLIFSFGFFGDSLLSGGQALAAFGKNLGSAFSSIASDTLSDWKGKVQKVALLEDGFFAPAEYVPAPSSETSPALNSQALSLSSLFTPVSDFFSKTSSQIISRLSSFQDALLTLLGYPPEENLAVFPAPLRPVSPPGPVSTSTPSQELARLKAELLKARSQGLDVSSAPSPRVIERVIQTSIQGLSAKEVDQKLSLLNQALLSEISQVRLALEQKSQANFNAIALTNRINSLSQTQISSPTITTAAITQSTFSGTSITSDTATLGTLHVTGTADIGGALTVSGSQATINGNVTISYLTATSTTATSTFAGRAEFDKAPAQPHLFSAWATGVASSSVFDSTLFINPASAVADSNLLGLAVNGSPKALIDAEGDLFVRNITAEGSVTQGATTLSSLSVENASTFGDAITDAVTFNSGSISYANRATTTIPNLAVNAWSIATSTSNIPLFTLSTASSPFGLVGIGTTSPGATLSVAGGGLFNSLTSYANIFGPITATSTLNISGAITSTASGANVLPYASSTALTVSGTGFFGTASSTNLTVSSLTSGRIPYITTAGAFTDSSALTWNNSASRLSATYASSTAVSAANLDLSGALTANSATLTTALGIASGGTNATSFTTSGNAVYYTGSALATAPLGSAITIPYASTTAISSTGSAFFAASGGSVGIASTSPWGLLSVNPNGITGPAFVVGSSTATNFIVTNAGNVGIGTMSPSDLLHVAKESNLNIYAQVSSANTNSPQFIGRKSRGSIASPSDIVNGDTMASLSGQAYSGATWFDVAQMNIEVDGTFTSGQRPPSRLTFYTNVANTGTAERMRITSGGNVGIGTTSPGATLSVAGGGLFNSLTSYSSVFGPITATSTLNISGAITSTASGANVFPYASTTALTVSGTGFFGTASSTNLTVSSLTSGRVPYITTAGAFTDSSALTWNNSASRLSATYASSTAVSASNLDLSGALTANSATLTTALGIASGGTNAASFTTSGNAVYYTGSALATAPLGSAVTIPYASTTAISSTGSAFFATSGGNVGIGTTGPSGTLHVRTSTPGAATIPTNADDAIIENSGDGGISIISPTTGSGRIAFVGTAAEADRARIIFYHADSATQPDQMVFSIAGPTPGAGDRMTITGSGNVGIGTTSPSTTLSVTGSSYFTTALGILAVPKANGLQIGTAGTVSLNPSSDIVLTNNDYFDSAGNRKRLNTNAGSEVYQSAGDISFATFPSGGSVDGAVTGIGTRMIIKNDGNVGIGTTSPSGKFAITGGGTGTGRMLVLGDFANTERTVFLDNGNIMMVASFSIGKLSAPGQALDVLGTVRQSNCTTATTLSANTSGDIICTPSAARFKHNIQSLTSSDGLAIVNALNPVSFVFNSDVNMGSSTQVGFIAEEANLVDPRLVAVNEKTGQISGFHYENYTAILTKAVQELDAKVSGLALGTVGLLDLRNNDIINARRILSSSGLWSIDENGKLIAKEVQTENLNVSAAVKFGSTDKRIGITIYDEDTGSPYCLKIKNGAVASAAGECGSTSLTTSGSTQNPPVLSNQTTASSTATASSTPIASDIATTTAPALNTATTTMP